MLVFFLTGGDFTAFVISRMWNVHVDLIKVDLLPSQSAIVDLGYKKGKPVIPNSERIVMVHNGGDHYTSTG